MSYIDYIYSERYYSCFIDILSFISNFEDVDMDKRGLFFLVIVHLLSLHHYIILMHGM